MGQSWGVLIEFEMDELSSCSGRWEPDQYQDSFAGVWDPTWVRFRFLGRSWALLQALLEDLGAFWMDLNWLNEGLAPDAGARPVSRQFWKRLGCVLAAFLAFLGNLGLSLKPYCRILDVLDGFEMAERTSGSRRWETRPVSHQFWKRLGSDWGAFSA